MSGGARFQPSRIDDSALLTSIFGYWPSFHDAEVVAVRLNRAGDSGGPELETDIHLGEMTSTLTPDGFYEVRHHTLTTLLFEGIDEVSLEGFNGQNALFGLQIDDIADHEHDLLRWEVAFDAAHGLGAVFRCARIRVVAAEPCDRAGLALRESPGTRVTVSFRLRGNSLDPDSITEHTGIAPAIAYRKGDLRRLPDGRDGAPHRHGMWSVSTEGAVDRAASIDEHLSWLLDRLEPVGLELRAAIDSGATADFFCGYFMEHLNSGWTVRRETLERIAKLGAELGLDIYGP